MASSRCDICSISSALSSAKSVRAGTCCGLYAAAENSRSVSALELPSYWIDCLPRRGSRRGGSTLSAGSGSPTSACARFSQYTG